MPLPYPGLDFAYPAGIDAFDHIDLVVGDLDRSLEFYRGLLRFLGYAGEVTIEGEQGERVVYLHRHDGTGAIGFRQRRSGGDAHDRYAIGLHHLALRAARRDSVDEMAAWAVANGARIESGPAQYDYTPGYYAVFLRDPDDLKLEIVHRPAEEELAARIAELERRLDDR